MSEGILVKLVVLGRKFWKIIEPVSLLPTTLMICLESAAPYFPTSVSSVTSDIEPFFTYALERSSSVQFSKPGSLLLDMVSGTSWSMAS